MLQNYDQQTKDDFQLEQHMLPRETDKNDLQVFLPLILKNWYWFVFAVIVALLGVRFYMNHTMPVYRTSATILINETGERSFMDNSEILHGLGLPGGMRNVQNQIMILSSIALTESTLRELPFEVEYYFRTIRNILPITRRHQLRLLLMEKSRYPETQSSLLNF